MKRSIIIALAIVIVLAVGGAFVLQALTQPAAEVLESITIGHVPVESFALLYVAQNQSYFAQNGLNVTILDYATGTTAVEALTSGAVDVAGSSEYVVTVNAVEKQEISIIAACGESQIVDLIGRQDHGINAPADLKGKTVATAQGTVAEFDLGRFLIANGLTLQDINLVYLAPAEFASAIGSGSVDAVVSWQIYSEAVRMQLGEGYVEWPLQLDEPFFSVLSCRNDWLASHEQTVQKLLTALSQAEDYLNSNPAQTQQVVKDKFNYTDAYIASVWSQNNCSLQLNPKLPSVMEQEADWMISNNLTTQKTMPAISEYINTAPLRAVKPHAVTLP